MNKPEFDRWWSDLTLRFPNVEAWLLRNHDTELSQRTLLKTWLDVMGDVRVSYALEVNRQMQAGELEFVADFHEQDIPKHVRRLARELAWQREGNRDQGDLPPLGNKGTGFPARQILERWKELEGQGANRSDARKQAIAEFTVGTSPHREPRFNCLNCKDSGRVHVASNAAIEAMLLGTFETCHHRDGMAKCRCSAGSRLVRKLQGREVPWVVFDPALDFAVMDPLWGDEERQRFTEWVAEQRESRWQAMAQSSGNYEPAFGDWNNR